MLEFVSPFKISLAGVVSAELRGKLRKHSSTLTTVPLTVVNGTGAQAGTATLTTTADLAGGVYYLQVTTDDACCCYKGLVYVSGCEVASFPTTHEGDAGVNEPVPSCDPVVVP